MEKGLQNIKDRFDWAVSVLKPGCADCILEVGCGAGILVERLATVVTKGKITAIDKSAPIIQAARKRNNIYIEKGTVQFLTQDFHSFSSGAYLFDKIVAFNVRAFWKYPTQYLPLIKDNLTPDGKFYLFYQPPFDDTRDLAQQAEAVLKSAGYQIDDVLMQDFRPAPAFCIICAPK